jgi:hypothetical protein
LSLLRSQTRGRGFEIFQFLFDALCDAESLVFGLVSDECMRFLIIFGIACNSERRFPAE